MAIGGIHGFRMERSAVESVDVRANFHQLLLHAGVERHNIGLAEEAARDSGLVGRHQDHDSQAIKPCDRPFRTGDPGQILKFVDVAMVHVQDAVPIEEYRRPFGHAL